MSGLPMPQAQSDGPRLRHKMLSCASSARAKCARAPRNASCTATDKASCSTNCCRGRRIGRRPWKTPKGWGCRKLCGLKPGPAASDDWRSRTLADIAADLYADGAAGAMLGGQGCGGNGPGAVFLVAALCWEAGRLKEALLFAISTMHRSQGELQTQ